ncbi:LysR family transcriptional regulator [Vibrio sp. HN007]|uniref:LysR family transcriptional regulator n=1 Tax=Vibrio iocasae TaxID=3098914 RepID=UPI0035D4CA96
MDRTALHNLDLNLLKVFKVLSEERKATLAAKRLGMTQPAVSRSLARLRNQLDDELFVRTRDGLTPTEKGQLLCDKLPFVMESLDDLINELQVFDPSTHTATLKIAMNNFLSVSLPAQLHLRIRESAPNINLYIESWSKDSVARLRNGELDMGITYYSSDVPKEIIRTTLAYDRFQLLARKDHPLVERECTSADLAQYPMVSAIVPDWNEQVPLIKTLGAKDGEELQIDFRSESITALAEIAACSDAIFPASAYLSRDLFPQLTSLEVEDSFQPKPVEFSVFNHYRFRQSPLHKWFLQLFREVTQDMVVK